MTERTRDVTCALLGHSNLVECCFGQRSDSFISVRFPRVMDGAEITGSPAFFDHVSRGLIEGREDASGRVVYADAINGYDMNANILRAFPREDFLYCVTDGRWNCSGNDDSTNGVGNSRRLRMR